MIDGQAAMANPNDEFGRIIAFFGWTSKTGHNQLVFKLVKIQLVTESVSDASVSDVFS